MISGGVITAAKIINITNECRLYCLRKLGVINPNLLRKYINTGKRKTIPFAKHTVVTVEI